ncbi:MAG: diguanylate cyclase [Magnetococcales bacterium]|nr:diguanylate cyclase [Magnetococcales bacterium]
MLKYRFLRNSFLISILIAITLPLYSVFFTIPHFSSLLTANTEEDAIKVANHLVSIMKENAADQSNILELSPQFKDQTHLVVNNFHVMKYRIFAPDGEIIHSSVKKEIGDRNTKDYFQNKVAKGEVFSKTASKNQKSMEGETLSIDVVETYVPIMAEGRFQGAFEIYFDITQRKQRMDREILHTTITLITISLCLLFLVFFVRRSVIFPISQVTGAMSKLASGNLEQRVPIVGKDEISDMARIFNQMCLDLKLTHQGLESEKKKLNTILLGAREGIVATDDQGKVVLVNPSAQRLLGKTEMQIAKEGFLNLFDDPDFLHQFMEKSGVGMPDILVFNNHVLSVYASTIKDSGEGVIGSAVLIRDVTEEKKLEEQLRDLSHTDGLTNLFNRRRMDELVKEEFDRARRYKLEFGFLLFDVDHFKRFNDEHGHDQGDRVLQAIAFTMKDHFRNVDYCCRYGGEEFCVIMPNTIAPGIVDAADRFRKKIEDLRVDGLQVTISIGIAIYPHSGYTQDCNALIKAADIALYRAKEGGRNQVCTAGQSH